MPKPAAATPAASGNRHARRSAKHRSAVSPFAAAFGMESPKEDDDAKAARRAEEDKQKEGESDEDYASRKAEQEKARKAEDEKEKKEAAEEDDDTDMETTDDEKCEAARAEGFAAGGARWSDTLASKEAKGKGMSAMSLLANTEMSSEQIRAALAGLQPDAISGGAVPAATAPGLSRRMADERVDAPAPQGAPATGREGEPISAASITAAAALVRGEKPAAA